MLPNTFSKFIWFFLRPYKWTLAGIVLLAGCTGAYGTIISYLIKVLIDSIAMLQTQEGLSSQTIMHVSLWPSIFFVANYEIHDLLWRGVDYLNLKTAPRIKNDIIQGVFAYIHKHSIEFFQDNFAGAISNNITLLVDNIEKIVHNASLFIITTSVQLLIALIAMYQVHMVFAGGLLLWVVGFLAIRLSLAHKAKALAQAYAHSQSLVSGKLVDSFQGIRLTRLFARSHYEVSYLNTFLESMREKFVAKEWFVFIISLWQGISISVLIAFMLFCLVHLKTQNKVSIGDFALILGLVLTITKNMWTLTHHIDTINDAIGKCNQGLKMLLSPLGFEAHTEIHKKTTLPQAIQLSAGAIEFRAVDFCYPGAAPFFSKQSVYIAPGERVGLVGYSGSGKSTFINLILRLFDVNGGAILIDGQDIKSVDPHSLRENIATIPQDPILLHRSLMDNIRYGALQATDAQVIEAAKKAQAHDFIESLSEGYETIVGEGGVKLSGGQKQRIAIARAILKNAPIFILDEATSQLDMVTQTKIQRAFWDSMQGKTTIVIAHRLSTLLHMARILA